MPSTLYNLPGRIKLGHSPSRYQHWTAAYTRPERQHERHRSGRKPVPLEVCCSVVRRPTDFPSCPKDSFRYLNNKYSAVAISYTCRKKLFEAQCVLRGPSPVSDTSVAQNDECTSVSIYQIAIRRPVLRDDPSATCLRLHTNYCPCCHEPYKWTGSMSQCERIHHRAFIISPSQNSSHQSLHIAMTCFPSVTHHGSPLVCCNSSTQQKANSDFS